MNDLLQWLLRLNNLRFGQAGVDFDFARPMPLWGWALAAAGAFLLGWMSYTRLEGPRPARVILGTLRALLLLLITVLIAGPRLIKPNEVEEPDWVLVLVDRSASMTIRDLAAPDTGAAAPARPGARQSRDEQLRAALEASREVWSQLGAERVVVWLGFDAGAWELAPAASEAAGSPGRVGAVPPIGEPIGRRTDLNRALEQGLRRAAARPLSGVVVLSDGRSLDEPSRAVMRRLEAEKVPVFTVPLGSARGVADLAVRRAEAPRTAFIRDTVPVEVELERIGGVPGDSSGSPAPTPTATVELVDNSTGSILDSREVGFEPTAADAAGTAAAADVRRKKITLLTRPTVAGTQNWSVRVRPPPGRAGTADAITEDLVEDNNRADVPVELVDRPLRVLYLDGYPRWEYRYLKNVLLRESSIASVSTILAPGRRYIQEGTEALDALPGSPEEWGRFDVLILGDVYPSVFTPDQLAQIRDRIATAGLGLIWIAGDGAVPNEWRGTPLADLLPITAGRADGSGDDAGAGLRDAVEAWGEPVVMVATPAADQLGVLRLADEQTGGTWWPARLSDPATGWSQLRWAQRIDPRRLKPTAETLALARPSLARADGQAAETPLVISMRFGAGRSIYIGTDEIWRWRYGRGEFYTERFWLQIIRLLGRESVARSGKPAILRAMPDRAEIDQAVRIEVSLIDQSLVEMRPESLRVRLRREGGDEAADITLLPEARSTGAAAGAEQARATARVFASTWIPTESGRYRIDAVDPLLAPTTGRAADQLSASVEVWQPDDELHQPQTNHPLLAELSRATGGAVLPPEDLSQLPRLLPNRRLRLAGDPDVQTLWDTPLALILVIGLLTAEWIGRRLLRLA